MDRVVELLECLKPFVSSYPTRARAATLRWNRSARDTACCLRCSSGTLSRLRPKQRMARMSLQLSLALADIARSRIATQWFCPMKRRKVMKRKRKTRTKTKRTTRRKIETLIHRQNPTRIPAQGCSMLAWTSCPIANVAVDGATLSWSALAKSESTASGSGNLPSCSIAEAAIAQPLRSLEHDWARST